MPRRAIVFLALLCIAAFALVADWIPVEQRLSAEQRHATGLDTLAPAQLALLNRLLREQTERVVAEARTEVRAEARAEAASAAPPSAGKADPALLAGMDSETIRSRLLDDVGGWAPGTEFRLANGQVWKVLKGNMTLRKPIAKPEIVVIPGFAGRWFLQVDEDLPKARVYRID